MAKAPAKETASPGKARKGKDAAIQESLNIPEKFKEEDRIFLGTKDTRTEEREQGIVGKVMNLALYGNLKVTLDHLEAMINKNAISEVALDQHLRFYIKKGSRNACATLKCIAQILIERVRTPGVAMGAQVVLLFKAIDCMRMYIQYSTMGADNLPSFLILQLMAKMPPAFIPHMNREKQIFNLNISMQRAIKEDLPTINIRNKLANLYLKQKCYNDALFQYEMMLKYFLQKKPQSPSDKEKICVIHLNIAEMYRDIYDFKGEFKNGQILQNFIFRYNRDADLTVESRTKISEITGPVNKLTVSQLYKDLKQLTISHYEIALSFFPKNKNQKKRSEILVTLGKSYADTGKAVEAAEALQDSLLLLGKERNSPEIFKGKDEVLEIMRNCVAKVAAGTKKEKLKSFIVKEENKLESDKLDWEEEEKRKEQIRKEAEKGGKKKVL